MNGTWTIGFPLVVLAFSLASLVWEDHKDTARRAFDRAVAEIRETLESIGGGL